MLHAINKFRQRAGSVKFRIGGSGPHSKAYQQLAKTLDIASDVEWLGELTREQAVKEFQHCQAFILPSLYESMGIVYIEALACGKPIIATKCGGPESIVTPFNGLLVEKNNPDALAAAMLNMIKNYKSYDSNIIRQDFLNRFSSKAVLPQLLQCYQDVIENHIYKP
ncbi:glycosyltransferase family 4 protein [Pontibacter sp. 172403-2]|nr:glycosyltransferase family 4 protein [Pontibacter sp. 172403-2]